MLLRKSCKSEVLNKDPQIPCRAECNRTYIYDPSVPMERWTVETEGYLGTCWPGIGSSEQNESLLWNQAEGQDNPRLSFDLH